MKNKEKFEKEIMEIACKSGAVNKQTGELKSCNETLCKYCLFRAGSCEKEMRAWLESEYIENPVISKRDRDFLDYINANVHYIARDLDGVLYVYTSNPCKASNYWSTTEFEINKGLRMIDIDLPMVKWSDDSPWLIEDLKKLEVVDSYE